MTTVITQLPLSSDPAYRYTIGLEGQARQLYFYWNTKSMSWQLDIRNTDQSPVVLGMRLVPQYPMAVDYALEDKSMTGYFLLVPNNFKQTQRIQESLDIMVQFFKLYYIYIRE